MKMDEEIKKGIKAFSILLLGGILLWLLMVFIIYFNQHNTNLVFVSFIIIYIIEIIWMFVWAFKFYSNVYKKPLH